MDWKDMALGSLSAAQALSETKSSDTIRSSVSRSYYATYCAITHLLNESPSGRKLPSFPGGWKNPSHQQLKALVSQLPISDLEKSKLKRQLNFLQAARTDADYRPSISIEEKDCLAALKVSTATLKLLGFS